MSGDKIIQKIEEEAKQDAAAIGAAAQEKARKEKEQILAKAREEEIGRASCRERV